MTTKTEEDLRVEWLDYEGVMAITGLSRATIWRSVKSGALKSSGSGAGIRFERSEVVAWMRSRR